MPCLQVQCNKVWNGVYLLGFVDTNKHTHRDWEGQCSWSLDDWKAQSNQSMNQTIIQGRYFNLLLVQTIPDSRLEVRDSRCYCCYCCNSYCYSYSFSYSYSYSYCCCFHWGIILRSCRCRGGCFDVSQQSRFVREALRTHSTKHKHKKNPNAIKHSLLLLLLRPTRFCACSNVSNVAGLSNDPATSSFNTTQSHPLPLTKKPAFCSPEFPSMSILNNLAQKISKIVRTFVFHLSQIINACPHGQRTTNHGFQLFCLSVAAAHSSKIYAISPTNT